MTLFPAHGGQLRGLSAQFDIPTSELLDFSANINPEGPPPAVLMVLREALEDLSVLTIYPDLEQTDLRLAIGHYAGVPANQLSVSNGFVPLLEAVLKTFSIRKCLLPVPAFNEYRKALERAQVDIRMCRLSSEDSFSYDLDALTTGDHDAILLANPQNPSGVLCDIDTIMTLVVRAKQRNMYVLLDEAFIDYQPHHSAAAYAATSSNLIIFRSVTKFHAIPGLRVAYAISSTSHSAAVQRNLAPWPVTNLASLAVTAALSDSAYADVSKRLNEQRRTSLELALNALGIATYPSAANFLLLRLPDTIDETVFWRRMLAEHHIVLRSCHDYEFLSRGHLRVAVKTSSENDHLLRAITALLSTWGTEKS